MRLAASAEWEGEGRGRPAWDSDSDLPRGKGPEGGSVARVTVGAAMDSDAIIGACQLPGWYLRHRTLGTYSTQEHA